MNNTTNYPGWKSQPIYNDMGMTAQTTINTNGSEIKFRNILSNIAKGQYAMVSTSGILYFTRGNWGTDYTQSYWQTNYPNLVFEIAYPITNAEAQYEEPITQEEVINQLNAIYNALSYNKETNIIIESSNAQMIASVSVVEGE